MATVSDYKGLECERITTLLNEMVGMGNEDGHFALMSSIEGTLSGLTMTALRDFHGELTELVRLARAKK